MLIDKMEINTCSEIAIFKVPEKNRARVIELSLSIVKEINADKTVILSHEILSKIDNSEEICWHLTWLNKEAVTLIAKKWQSFPSSKELESLVTDKIYYGHFVSLF